MAYRLLLALILIHALVANQDPWKGDEYAKHSASQQASADDFLQGISFQGVRLSVLDVGSGDGKITAGVAKLIPDGTVVGVDISPSMVEVAQKQFSSLNNLQFQIQDAAKLEFVEEFDLITSFTVMHWVLEQAEALRCFERALKPGGTLWIQMPTDLPQAMKQALERVIGSEKWQQDFAHFKAPWRFYQPEEYKALLQEAKFQIASLRVVPKHEKSPSREACHGFLRQWFPYLRPLAENRKDLFLTELLDLYLQILPPDEQGRVSFIVDRLEVEARKGDATFNVEAVAKEITEELAQKLQGNPTASPFVLLVGGYPGAGKTALIQAIAQSHNVAIVSLNDVRQCLLDRKTRGSLLDWDVIQKVYQNLLTISLEKGFNVAIDTNAHSQKMGEVESFLQQDPHGRNYKVVKILLHPSTETLFSRIRARVQMEGVHQGTEHDLKRDLATPFKRIDPSQYDLVIDTEKTSFAEELAQVDELLK